MCNGECSWESGTDKLRNKNLPEDKQFLVTPINAFIVLFNIDALDNKKCALLQENY